MCSPVIVLRGQAAVRFVLLGVFLAAAPVARAQSTAPPSPSSPAQAIALLKWCWEHRDANRYRELFTADYRFVTTADPDSIWTREQELNAAAALFGSGTAGQPGAFRIAIGLEGNPQPGTAFLPGKPYPWHQQILVSGAYLEVDRTDGSTLRSRGRTLFHLVRGDSANIPQELRDRGFVADSSRWYVERWEDEPDVALVLDHPPVVTVVPETATVPAGFLMTLLMEATDPDGDPITGLSFEGPPGANFVRASGDGRGWLSWTPAAGDVGTHRITFRAFNRLDASVRATVQVVPGAQPPVASLVATPSTGTPPLRVRLDASGSWDPDGTIVGYQFTFGDGNVSFQASPIAEHVYGEGSYRPSVVVRDNHNFTSRAEVSVTTSRRPTAQLTTTPRSGTEPLVVDFDASGSRAFDGAIARYTMTFGDGSPAESTTTPAFRHTYRAGNWTAVLTVRDSAGMTATASQVITVTQDRPPSVSAPVTVSGKVGSTMMVQVTASDPDNQPITSLTASGPPGSTFTSDPDHLRGTFSWTPDTAGQSTVRFTASNTRAGMAETVLKVAERNRPPTAALTASPNGGTEPQVVLLDASGSRDPDGVIVSYRFEFGDGTSLATTSSIVSHTYMAGHWTAGVTVLDAEGATSTASFGIEVLPLASFAGAKETVERLASAWRNRDVEACRDVLADDFRFTFAPADPAGNGLPDRAWNRDEELAVVGRLFGAGFGDQPPASSVTLQFHEPPLVGHAPGRSYPWHLQVLAPRLTLGIERSSGSYEVTGAALFTMVRGDSVRLPQDLLDRGVGPDSTRWYVEGWQDWTGPFPAGNQMPFADLTVAPAGGVAPLVVRLDASRSRDYDGVVVSFRFDFGDGTSVTQASPVAVHSYGAGTWYARVTAIDHLGAERTASTSFTVRRANLPPTAALTASPNGGTEPQTVLLDASGSRDPDGVIASYSFEFGDGTSLTTTSPRTSHTYMAGHWDARVTVADGAGVTSTASCEIEVRPFAAPNLARNPSFESDGRYWNSYAGSTLDRVVGEGHEGQVGLRVTGPAVVNGSFGVNDSPDQVRWTLGPGIRYRYKAWVRSPSSRGQAKLRVTEYLIAGGVRLGMATSDPVTLTSQWQQLSVDYVTTAANSTLDFQVRDWPVGPSEEFFTDDIVIENVTTPGAGTGMASWYHGEDPIGLQPRLVPSPIRQSGTLTFMTSDTGPLRVEILDLAGRRMRRLMDQDEAPAGLYDLAIGRHGGDGPELKAGVYFYRIEAREGARSGRFVVLP